jgi:tRNA(Leu) C34 or U34 (ribose-2'-O)-methylase TrmL
MTWNILYITRETEFSLKVIRPVVFAYYKKANKHMSSNYVF